MGKIFIGDINYGTFENQVIEVALKRYNVNINNILPMLSDAGELTKNPTKIDLVFDGIKDIGTSSLENTFHSSQIINSVVFPDCENLSGQNCLYSCFQASSIEELSFPNLVSVTGYNSLNMICYSSNISKISFPKLRKISGDSCFYAAFKISYSTTLKEASFPELEEITGDKCFWGGCFNNQGSGDFIFPKLRKIGTTSMWEFFRRSQFVNIYFPQLTEIEGTSPFGINSSYDDRYTFDSTYIKEIHFRKDMENIISNFVGYSSKWGATNATIYFDL